MNKNIKTFNQFINENKSNVFIAYHSTNSEIKEFNFNDIEIKPNSSTRIDGIFFTDIPQKSWGDNVYKVEIISSNPARFDISNSRLDSLSVQEAFNALLKGETSYMIEDLVEYGGMELDDAVYLVNIWVDCDLIVIENCQYAKHNIEYIIPDRYYNGNSAIIINLGKVIV